MKKQTYADRAGAERGAKRKGLEKGTYTVMKNIDGRWEVILADPALTMPAPKPEPAPEPAPKPEPKKVEQKQKKIPPIKPELLTPGKSTAGEKVVAPPKKAPATTKPAAKKPEPKKPAPKSDAFGKTRIKTDEPPNKSIRPNPVNYVWTEAPKLHEKKPDITRAEAVQYFIDKGIAYNTAKTQYQRWRKAEKK